MTNRKSRGVGTRSTRLLASERFLRALAEDEFIPGTDAGAPRVGVDAAVGRTLAARILAEHQDLAEALRERAPLVIVEAPTEDMVVPVHDGLLHAVFGEPPGDEEPDMPDPAERVLSFVPVGKDRHFKPDEGNASVRRALERGRPILGVSHAPGKLLPSELIRIAERRIAIPAFDGAALHAVARLVAGAPAAREIPDTTARRVTMADLALAVRADGDADAYVDRVLALVSARLRPPGLTLDRLHGMPEVVAWGTALARDLQDYEAGRIGWADVDRGVLLYGPPGNGKTTAARAVAGTCGIPLVLGSFAQWQASGYLNDMLKAMIGTFDQARALGRCVLFIDELDAVGDRAKFHGKNATYETMVANALLEQLDGMGGREGVVVIGATNHPDQIDPAILRPGRLDRRIHIGPPDEAALQGILRFHLRDDLAGQDLVAVAAVGAGCSSAQAEQWVRDARRVARQARRAMTLADLLAVVRAGRPPLSIEQRRRVAVHEAGHALLAILDGSASIERVSLVESDNAGGAVTAIWNTMSLLTPSGVLARLRCILGARAAEEVALGVPSSGAGGGADSDLAKATTLALTALSAFGMREGDQALLWSGMPDPGRVPMLLATNPVLAREVSALLATAYAQATDMLRRNRAALDEIVDALLGREVLGGAEVAAIVARRRARVSANAPTDHLPDMEPAARAC